MLWFVFGFITWSYYMFFKKEGRIYIKTINTFDNFIWLIVDCLLAIILWPLIIYSQELRRNDE